MFRFPFFTLMAAAGFAGLCGCKPESRAEIERIKADAAKLEEEEDGVDREVASAKAELDVLMRAIGESARAERDLEEKLEQLKAKLSRVDAASEAVKAQLESLKAAHAAYRKDNRL